MRPLHSLLLRVASYLNAVDMQENCGLSLNVVSMFGPQTLHRRS